MSGRTTIESVTVLWPSLIKIVLSWFPRAKRKRHEAARYSTGLPNIVGADADLVSRGMANTIPTVYSHEPGERMLGYHMRRLGRGDTFLGSSRHDGVICAQSRSSSSGGVSSPFP